MVEKKTPLVVAAFAKKEERKRQRQQAKQAHNLLLSIVVFLHTYSLSKKSLHMEKIKKRIRKMH